MSKSSETQTQVVVDRRAMDHDLLIQVHTQMLALRDDFKSMKDENAVRLAKLELGKFESKDFTETWGRMILDHDSRVRVSENAIVTLNGAIATFISDLKENKIRQETMQASIETLVRGRSSFLGGLSVINVLLAAVISIVTAYITYILSHGH